MSVPAWPKECLDRSRKEGTTLFRYQIRTAQGGTIEGAGDFKPEVALAAYKILMGHDPHKVAQELAPNPSVSETSPRP